MPLSERLANAAVSCASYLAKTLFPFGLSVHYAHPYRQPLWLVGVSLLILVLVTALAWRLRKEQPLILFGWCWFVGLLVPVLGLVQAGGAAMADRYTYLSLIGIFLMLIALKHHSFERSVIRRTILPWLIAVSLVGLAIMTVRQLGFWQNNYTLFKHALEVDPGDALAHDMLGSEYARMGHLSKAEYHYAIALAKYPNMAYANLHMGLLMEFLDKPIQAIPYFAKVLSDRNVSGLAYAELAGIYYNLGMTSEAVAHYKRAIELKDNLTLSKYLLAKILATDVNKDYRDGKLAITLGTELCQQSNFENPVFLDLLGAAYAETGLFSAAIRTGEDALIKASRLGASNFVAAISNRLTLYRCGTAYHEPRSSLSVTNNHEP